MSPSGGSLTVLTFIYVVLGAAIGSVRLEGIAAVASISAALCGCQIVGHLVLAMGYCHPTAIDMSAPMLLAHGAAAVVFALLINLAEYFFTVCATLLTWLRIFTAAPRTLAAPTLPAEPNPVVFRRILLSAGLGMRAPPVAAGVI